MCAKELSDNIQQLQKELHGIIDTLWDSNINNDALLQVLSLSNELDKIILQYIKENK